MRRLLRYTPLAHPVLRCDYINIVSYSVSNIDI